MKPTKLLLLSAMFLFLTGMHGPFGTHCGEILPEPVAMAHGLHNGHDDSVPFWNGNGFGHDTPPAQTPEPSTFVLLGSALVGGLVLRRLLNK